MKHAGGLLLALYVLAWPARLAPGQPNQCDPHLVQPSADPNGYRLRGDRCEGIYIQDVAGSPLFIASWTESFADYDLLSNEPLVIAWDSLRGAGAVRLRAQGLRRRLYYRMDAIRPQGSGSFAWHSELLGGLRIPRRDVGVVGIARARVDDAVRDVYLPLRITQTGKPVPSGGYQLVLLPGVELREIFLTLSSVAPGKSAVLKNAEPLGYGYYPAERALQIPISGMRAPGLYHLEIAATLSSGGASTVDLWFYHAGS